MKTTWTTHSNQPKNIERKRPWWKLKSGWKRRAFLKRHDAAQSFISSTSGLLFFWEGNQWVHLVSYHSSSHSSFIVVCSQLLSSVAVSVREVALVRGLQQRMFQSFTAYIEDEDVFKFLWISWWHISSFYIMLIYSPAPSWLTKKLMVLSENSFLREERRRFWSCPISPLVFLLSPALNLSVFSVVIIPPIHVCFPELRSEYRKSLCWLTQYYYYHNYQKDGNSVIGLHIVLFVYFENYHQNCCNFFEVFFLYQYQVFSSAYESSLITRIAIVSLFFVFFLGVHFTSTVRLFSLFSLMLS